MPTMADTVERNRTHFKYAIQFDFSFSPLPINAVHGPLNDTEPFAAIFGQLKLPCVTINRFPRLASAIKGSYHNDSRKQLI